jgi:hypothetical protein
MTPQSSRRLAWSLMTLIRRRKRCIGCGAGQPEEWPDTVVIVAGYGGLSMCWCEECSRETLTDGSGVPNPKDVA